MQALRRAVSTAMPGFRRASTTAGETIDKYWAPYFPKPAVTADEAKKSVNKEMVGFMLLGERWDPLGSCRPPCVPSKMASERMRTPAGLEKLWRGFERRMC